MNKRMYHEDFKSWKDVSSQFRLSDSVREPTKIWAQYEIDGYDGCADVVFKVGRKWYHVKASHCSCYGLEGQWEPEELDVELFLKSVEDGSPRKMLGWLTDEKSLVAWLKEMTR